MEEIGVTEVSRFEGGSTFKVSAGALSLHHRLMKRTLDLAITVPVLVVLSPLMLAVAIAIKLESRGSVFFRQERLGRGNRLFLVYKFRSMRVEKCDENGDRSTRSEEHTSELQSLMRISYAVFCLNKQILSEFYHFNLLYVIYLLYSL